MNSKNVAPILLRTLPPENDAPTHVGIFSPLKFRTSNLWRKCCIKWVSPGSFPVDRKACFLNRNFTFFVASTHTNFMHSVFVTLLSGKPVPIFKLHTWKSFQPHSPFFWKRMCLCIVLHVSSGRTKETKLFLFLFVIHWNFRWCFVGILRWVCSCVKPSFVSCLEHTNYCMQLEAWARRKTFNNDWIV